VGRLLNHFLEHVYFVLDDSSQTVSYPRS